MDAVDITDLAMALMAMDIKEVAYGTGKQWCKSDHCTK